MPNCPNCSQPTARTEDWACQWCGYPLISGGYKKIPKTYRQLKEERLQEHRERSHFKKEIVKWLDDIVETMVDSEPDKQSLITFAENGHESKTEAEGVTELEDQAKQ